MTNPWDSYLDLLSRQQLVENVNCVTKILETSKARYPVTFNIEGNKQTSWVASLINAYGPYARAELDLIGETGVKKIGYTMLSLLAQSFLGLSGLNGGIFFNNWLLATNLYDDNFDLEEILAAVRKIENNKYPIIIRSLTPYLHEKLLHDLVQNGFIIIPTRQVWIIPHMGLGKWQKHSDVIKDIKLENKYKATSAWKNGLDFTDSEWEKTHRLYNLLYRTKYPRFNPDYVLDFFKSNVEIKFLDLDGLFLENELVGFMGVIKKNDWFATPVLGYDLSKPARLGLYRRLMLKAFRKVAAQNGSLHCSAGAGDFKFQRGAQSGVEFAAVYVSKLPKHKQIVLKNLSEILLKIAVPFLENNKL